jgi:hypothetical protein
MSRAPAALRPPRPGSSVRAMAVTAMLLAPLAACSSKRPPADGRDADAIRGAVAGMRGQSAAPGSTPVAPWVNLLADTTLSGWHNYSTQGAPVVGWTLSNGELVRSGRGGDLTTNRTYTNFELELEWQVGPGGNSGVIYRIDHSGERSYISGPEMQILDDAVHADGKNPLTSAGANYALHAAPRGVVKPAGQWNSARLLVRGNHVEHWLNGVKVVEYELGSADWEERRRNSKFANAAQYGRASSGHIALQDHGDRVLFRNVRIRELP